MRRYKTTDHKQTLEECITQTDENYYLSSGASADWPSFVRATCVRRPDFEIVFCVRKFEWRRPSQKIGTRLVMLMMNDDVFCADVLSNYPSHSPDTRKSRTRTAPPPCAFANVLSNYSSHPPDTRKSRMRTASPPCAFADVLSNYSSHSPDTRKSRTRTASPRCAFADVSS